MPRRHGFVVKPERQASAPNQRGVAILEDVLARPGQPADPG